MGCMLTGFLMRSSALRFIWLLTLFRLSESKWTWSASAYCVIPLFFFARLGP